MAVSLILQPSVLGRTWAAAAAARTRSAMSTEPSQFISPWRSRISSRCKSARFCSSIKSSSSSSRIPSVVAAISKSATPTESSSRSGISVPWLMLPPSCDTDGMHNNFYDLKNNKVVSVRGEEVAGVGTRIVGSSHGWLALFKRSESELFLWNPLTEARINLPLTLEAAGGAIGFPTKLVLSCSPDDRDRCRAAVTYGNESRLAVLRPGVSTEWTPIGEWYQDTWWLGEGKEVKISRVYVDIAFSAIHNRLFCITHRGSFERWDIGNGVNKMEWSHDFRWPVFDEDEDASDPQTYYWKYVMVSEHSGEVLLVVRTVECSDALSYCKTVNFHVMKLDGDDLIYKEDTLDGQALFVGINQSLAIYNAAELGLKPDSIYFTTPTEHHHSNIHDHGIFSYQDRSFSTCYYASHVQKIQPPPLWYIH